MKHICVICIIALLFSSCNNSKTTLTQPSQLLPQQFDVVLKINSFESLENGLKNNNLIQQLSDYSPTKDLTAKISSFQKLSSDTSLISISKSKNDSLDVCLIFRIAESVAENNETSHIKLDSVIPKTNAVKSFELDEQIFHIKILDSICFVSNNKDLTIKARPTSDKRPEIEAFMRLSNPDKMISVLAKNDFFNVPIINNDIFGGQQFSDYSIFDAEISQNAIILNGITRGQDSLSTINIFKDLRPQQNNVANAIPNSSTHFKSYTFDDFDILKANLNRQFLLDSMTNNCSAVFQTINEIAKVTFDEQSSVIFKSIDPIATKELIDINANAVEFRGFSIYALDFTTLSNCIYPLITQIELNHLTILDNYFVFAQNQSVLETYISNYLNGSVLGESDHFSNMMTNMSDESSLLVYMNSDGLNTLTNSLNTDDIKLDISEYKSSAIQFVYDSDYAHINTAFTTHKRNRNKNNFTEELDIKLDSELITPPQLVRNHRTNQMDILTQDINNNLYLISNTGKVFWKKQLDGKIMGEVHQIDTYKNGRLQLVFNTPKRLYVLDRNGKDVNAFPLQFNDEITQPISVFDYDKKKNYRLMVTQGKSVLMYDKNGKTVSGFKYSSAKNSISSQPKHFRIERKDYIVFSEGNRIEILDRVGKTRINVQENISFSDNEIYLYQNKFTTTSTNGELIQINSKGTKSSKNLQVNSDHKITTTSKTLVVLNDNNLTIKSNNVALDFGVYTSPKIFYINDKIYVTVTDLQSKKAYLFDSQAKSIANFPVYANSEIELGNIDNDKALEVITKGDDNAIIVYELN
ncbi:MAG: ribonuclease HII [Psychroserpens sp.]|nr:ribonuclease HII [Psychroserpens sp.]